jgi:hypothetical protein
MLMAAPALKGRAFTAKAGSNLGMVSVWGVNLCLLHPGRLGEGRDRPHLAPATNSLKFPIYQSLISDITAVRASLCSAFAYAVRGTVSNRIDQSRRNRPSRSCGLYYTHLAVCV